MDKAFEIRPNGTRCIKIEVGYHSLNALYTQLDMSMAYHPKTDGQRKEERSLNNNSFLDEYECSSLALDERRDEKKRLDHLKQDQTMLVIKRFSERKKDFRERKKTEKFVQRGWFKEDEDGKKVGRMAYIIRKHKIEEAKETPKVLSRAWDKFFKIQHTQIEDIHELLHKLLEDLQIINEELAKYINSPSWNRHAFYDDDDEYSIQYKKYLENSSNAIAPVLPTEVRDNSLSMGDEHLSTILETESDEVIKSSVENLVPIPSESESISDDTCDVPFCDNSPSLDVLTDHFELFFNFNDDCTSSDDDYFEDIDYVEASPPDSKLVSLEEGELSSIAMVGILGKHRVYVPNILPTHPTLMLDLDFIPSDDSIRSDLEVSFPFRTRNKIFDTEKFFEVQSKRFLSRDTFSPTYVSLPFEDRHYLSFTYVIRTFLLYFTYPMESPFLLSSRSEDIIFDPGISVFNFSSLEPVAFKCPMEVCSSTCFVPNIMMISGESS
uniref:Reverse transcriptase domain-containing protein n=1 Tax=Tanacetum cinerariifolium TaxID=118510 RepID=A0A699GUG6_TANCI|nr:hypothetical protein [Tanacetum cinerariifolium]